MGGYLRRENMVKTKIDYNKYIEENTIRCEVSRRGGGIEIGISNLFPNLEDGRVSAFQNYLGGGMLGKINTDKNFDLDKECMSEKEGEILSELVEQLKRYFHDLTNHEDDEWEKATYKENQSRPASAY